MTTRAPLLAIALVTVAGQSFAQQFRIESEVFVNDSKVIKANNRASNGIVHVIDEVLIPPQDASPLMFATASSYSISSPASLRAASVPEPSTMVLAGSLVSMALLHRRRKGS